MSEVPSPNPIFNNPDGEHMGVKGNHVMVALIVETDAEGVPSIFPRMGLLMRDVTPENVAEGFHVTILRPEVAGSKIYRLDEEVTRWALTEIQFAIPDDAFLIPRVDEDDGNAGPDGCGPERFELTLYCYDWLNAIDNSIGTLSCVDPPAQAFEVHYFNLFLKCYRLEFGVDAKIEQIKNLQERLTVETATVQGSGDNVVLHQRELAKAQRQVANLNTELQAAKGKASVNDKALEVLSQENLALQKRLEQAPTAFLQPTPGSTDVAVLQEEITTLKEQLELAGQTIVEMQQDHDSARKLVQEADARTEEALKARMPLQHQIDQYAQAYNKLQADHEALLKENRNLRASSLAASRAQAPSATPSIQLEHLRNTERNAELNDFQLPRPLTELPEVIVKFFLDPSTAVEDQTSSVDNMGSWLTPMSRLPNQPVDKLAESTTIILRCDQIKASTEAKIKAQGDARKKDSGADRDFVEWTRWSPTVGRLPKMHNSIASLVRAVYVPGGHHSDLFGVIPRVIIEWLNFAELIQSAIVQLSLAPSIRDSFAQKFAASEMDPRLRVAQEEAISSNVIAGILSKGSPGWCVPEEASSGTRDASPLRPLSESHRPIELPS